MEAALRTVYEVVTGRELPFPNLHVSPIVGLEQVKEASFTITDPLPEYNILDGLEVRIAVTSGLAGAAKLMDKVKNGESPYHFIEVMGCPNGCIMGGGQPRSKDPDVRMKRLEGIYGIDENKPLRKSHQNPFIQALYNEYYGEPNGHRSHELLHTHYTPRGEFNELTDESYVAEGQILKLSAAAHRIETAKTAAVRMERKETESPKILELESDNRRLRAELQDQQETIEILKSLVSSKK